MSALGSYLTERRKALAAKHSGYSIRSVAKRIGIHHSYLSKLERGENAPLTEERIHALARLLGEDPDLLMALSGKLPDRITGLIRTNPVAFLESMSALEKVSGIVAVNPVQSLDQRKSELEELTRLLRDEIRERQILESQLRGQQRVQRTILENLQDVSVTLLDSQFHILWSNSPVTESPSSILNSTEHGVLNNQDNKIASESGAFCTAWRALKSRTVQNGAYRSPDGKHWLLRSAPVLDAQGEVTQIVHMQFEVTGLMQAKQALEASEERWKFALEGAQEAVWDYDVPSGRLQCSPMWFTMLGYREGELEPTISQWEALLHPEDRVPALNMLSSHFRGETERYDFEYRLRCSDGSFKWIHSRGKLMEKSATGSPVRIIGTHYDMSQRKAAEEQILANEAFLENLLGSIDEGISVIAPDMTVRYANQTMIRWYAEETPVVGRKCHQAFHRLGQCCSRCPAVRSLRTGCNEFEVLEIMSSTALRAIEFNSYPIKDAQSGAVTGVIVFVRDISSKRQIQQALTEVESKYHSIYEGAPIGMCTVDAKGRFVSMNTSYARIYGYASSREMMHSVRSVAELFESPRDLEQLGEMIRAQDEIFGFECSIRRADGSARWTSRTIRVVRDARGALLHYDVFVEDIEARKALELLAGSPQ
ncbi:MAG: PAS domain S-box protein [Desulfomicrobium sp.]|nr:PAS domain S-box protein [Pseudomonadota bacterium]MBV1713411.1 PAS domain S-box protein [Desulfomicrobium sp.]MBU4570455.1 PAS domain S-box protein [Pseudomonadota bacterium]MBU4593812.1 PAS domain S-box protein [Pseudomonadota bacterium]MBV1719734.1 PAS domain S-box protein [Desulfomicrobium sp.]